MNDTIDKPELVLSALKRENSEAVGLRAPSAAAAT